MGNSRAASGLQEEAAQAMDAIMDGDATPAQIRALLAAMAARGETEDEVVGFARTMRARAVPLTSQGAVDTCGTGGDGCGTFNISTVVSFVVAACGVPVAKHGNRSASGTCGSADVLEALGVRIDAPTATCRRRSTASAGPSCSRRARAHAPHGQAARAMGVRTAFGLLGPLTNPAQPEAQVVGVRRRSGARGARAQRLGTSGPGSCTARARRVRPTDDGGQVNGDSVRTFTVGPEEAGLRRPLEAPGRQRPGRMRRSPAVLAGTRDRWRRRRAG
jgi:anthranilate phosphoribosyltransferase